MRCASEEEVEGEVAVMVEVVVVQVAVLVLGALLMSCLMGQAD